MYSSFYLTKCLVLVHILATQLCICYVSSLNLTNEYLNHKCLTNQGNYKPGSAYEKELNSAIKTVCTSNLQRGTTTISSGESKTFSTVTIQCRGDSYGDKCRSCCVTAVDGFRKRCPTSKATLIWYDQCYLDVGTIPYPLIKNKIDYENTFSMHNPNNHY
ncbi:unnamed protein product [Cochlearia groenlandica]